jgi:hypothetical protein
LCFSVRGSSAFFFWDVRRRPGSGASGRHSPRPRSRPIWHGRLALEHPRQEQMSRQHRSILHSVGESCLFCCPSKEQQTRKTPPNLLMQKLTQHLFWKYTSCNFDDYREMPTGCWSHQLLVLASNPYRLQSAANHTFFTCRTILQQFCSSVRKFLRTALRTFGCSNKNLRRARLLNWAT